ncbi:MAG: GMC family oxidoreductase N-terminal domain-containing protein, partial [Rhizobiaceae bacterium]|nr:GMC family oxidoreductase N-terminal domain-containing protein [Rhizobiaceae bacterium]
MQDYIIVGGGSSGCVLANRLSEDSSNRVLLLEAGGQDLNFLIHMPAGFAKMTKGIASWGWSTVPQKHMKDRVFWYTQAKVIGGGSSINAQIYTRGNARDYDTWAKEDGCESWSYREILPYFKRAENNQRYANDYHGYGGPLGVSNPISPLPICEAFFQAGQELGIPFNPDFNGAVQEGLGYYQLTQKDAKRSSASVAYLKPIASRKNLTVRTDVFVTRVVVEKGRAVGVEIVERPGAQPQVLRAEREVIVSSGAIGSPKLLMQSGIGPADHLKAVGLTPVHDLPGVGSNLQDHLDLFVICECTGDHTYDNYAKPHRTLWAGIQYVLLKKGPAA